MKKELDLEKEKIAEEIDVLKEAYSQSLKRSSNIQEELIILRN